VKHLSYLQNHLRREKGEVWAQGKEAASKKPRTYPLGYVEDFLTSCNAAAGQRATFAAEDNFASSSFIVTIQSIKFQTPRKPLEGYDFREFNKNTISRQMGMVLYSRTQTSTTAGRTGERAT